MKDTDTSGHRRQWRPGRPPPTSVAIRQLGPRPPIRTVVGLWISRVWRFGLVSALVVLQRRFAMEAKVGRAASWSAHPELVQAFEKTQSSADSRPGGAQVKVLARHRKRLSAFVIDYIQNMLLQAYELSDHEDAALRRLLLDTADNGPGAITPLARHAARLVRYANRSALWDLGSTQELLSPAHLVQFMDWYRTQISEDQYNEARRFLVKAATKASPQKDFRQVPEGRRQAWSAPTQEEELEAQWHQANTYPVARIRRLLLALICLSRGAGLRAADLRSVRGSDVVPRSGGRTVVRVHHGDQVREIPVLRRFAAALRILAAASGEAPIFEGVFDRRGIMEPLRQLAGSWDLHAAVFPNPHQLANAYFLELAQRRVRVSSVFKVLPGKTIRGLEDLQRYMEDNPGGPADDLEGVEDTGIAYFSPSSPEDLE